MDNIENGWLESSDFYKEYSKEDVKCYCEWCERPIYYTSDYYVVAGERICYKCHDKKEDELMKEEMYGDE